MAGAGRMIFPNRSTLASTDVQDYLMDQVVMRFADAADRLAEVPTPTEGMVCTLGDTDALYRYNGTTWVRKTNGGWLQGVTTDGAGLYQFSHGLGATPIGVSLVASYQANDAATNITDIRFWGWDATTLYTRCYRRDTNVPYVTSSLSFVWSAHAW
jgi:hypothetical protein